MKNKSFIASGIPEYKELDQAISNSSNYKESTAQIDTYYNKEETPSISSSLFQRKDYIERKLRYEKGSFLYLKPILLSQICMCAAMVAETGTSVQVLNMSIKEIFLLLGILIPAVCICLEDKSISAKTLQKDRSRDGYNQKEIQKAALEYELEVIKKKLINK